MVPGRHADLRQRPHRLLEPVPGSTPVPTHPGYAPPGGPVAFATTGAQRAPAFFYRPANQDFQAPDGEGPPLRVHIPGGPTAMAGRALDLEVQYWTSRGFASVD